MGMPEIARFGSRGYVDGLRKRLSIKDIDVTPNHHAMARQWAISDNFYADSDVSVDGHHWLVGSYPNAWTESSLMAAYSDQKKDFQPGSALGAAPGRLLFAGTDASVHPEEQLENGTLWHHLERNRITFRNFGEGFELAGVDEGKDLEPTGGRFLTNVPMPDPLYRNTSRTYPGFNTNIPDQFRATQFIKEIEEIGLPQFVFIHLPNDHTAGERPDDGYPYRESFVADNDYALGASSNISPAARNGRRRRCSLPRTMRRAGWTTSTRIARFHGARAVGEKGLRFPSEYQFPRDAEDYLPPARDAAPESLRR